MRNAIISTIIGGVVVTAATPFIITSIYGVNDSPTTVEKIDANIRVNIDENRKNLDLSLRDSRSENIHEDGVLFSKQYIFVIETTISNRTQINFNDCATELRYRLNPKMPGWGSTTAMQVGNWVRDTNPLRFAVSNNTEKIMSFATNHPRVPPSEAYIRVTCDKRISGWSIVKIDTLIQDHLSFPEWMYLN